MIAVARLEVATLAVLFFDSGAWAESLSVMPGDEALRPGTVHRCRRSSRPSSTI